jgi:hypothetical protein
VLIGRGFGRESEQGEMVEHAVQCRTRVQMLRAEPGRTNSANASRACGRFVLQRDERPRRSEAGHEDPTRARCAPLGCGCQEPINDTWIFDDSQECLPAGESRIVFRNIAAWDGLVANLGSDAEGATDLTGATPLISDMAVGDEGTADVDAGTYPSNTAERMFGWETGSTDPFVGGNVQLPIPAGTIAYVYAHSGNDGPVGLAVTTRDVGVCDAPVTTSTTTTVAADSTTTTKPADGNGSAEAARPVAAQPTYTG